MGYRIRKHLRLPNYDYSQNGAYFITICTDIRENVFWEEGAERKSSCESYKLSKYGVFAEKLLMEIPERYPNVFIDEYIVMPNHIHLILRINIDGETDGQKATSVASIIAPTSVSTIVQQYKSAFTKRTGIQIWQKSFHEHIIRNGKDFEDICMYIQTNPEKWHDDKYNKFLMR